MNSSQSPVLGSPDLRRRTLLRWIKFNAVGAIGIVLQLSVLAALRSWMKLDYLLATAIAVEITVIHNFLWHEGFTWADRPAARWSHSVFRLVKFNLSNGAISMLGNLLLMRVFVGAFRANYLVANLFAIVVCSLVNFVVGDRLVFETA